MSQQRRASVAFVLVTLGLDAIGVGIIAPIVPGLVRQLTHLPPERAAPWVGALIAAYAGVQFLAAPILGELSDRFGRRPIILTSVFGLGCDYVFLTFAPNLWWLFAGRLIAGATSANVPAATAYIADVSRPEDRSRLFGLIGATFGAGFVIGPALGGFLGGFDLRLPFTVAAGLSFINLCFGFFVLPESLAEERRRPITWARANPFGFLLGVVRDRALVRLAVAWSCTWIGLGAVQSSLVLFTGYRFGWGSLLSGFVLAGVGLSQAVVEGFLLRHVTGRIGDRSTAIVGYLCGALGYGVLAIAFAGWTMIPAVALIALGGLATPSVRAMVSSRGAVNSQGEMQGVLSAVEGLTAIVAPMLTADLFYAFTTHLVPVVFPGAPFLFAAGSALLAGVLMRQL
ncbi:TCR/Tet family MFS transporter [Rhodopila sp.]|uniref:TCR/Tet family MFS transporter n=1 Tax=Rhodopila sp. TaxID=2480087 RepID=UPI003D106D43